IDRRGLSDGLAHVVTTALRGGAEPVAVSTGAGTGWLVEVDQLRHELDIARKMQEAILPRAFPRHPRVDLRASMTPALEVAGDFYDYFWLDDTRLGLVMADVSDKGIGAALFMAVSRTMLRAIALAAASPAAALSTVSGLLVEDNTTNMFVTVFYGVLDVETGTLVYANGGHNPPLVVAVSGAVGPLPKVRGAALGMFPDQRFQEGQTALPPDATLFLYTDGVTEAVTEDKIQFGMERLSGALAAHAADAPSAMLEAVLQAVDDFAAGTPKPDDITCLAVRWRRP
ncbi:MAG: PP2C family protein-serine/threonine phosphatase, partial [Gammaproteobacteria bacterium]